MSTYEMTLELPPLTEAQEDNVVIATGGVVAVHHGVTTVTLDEDGVDFIAALQTAVQTLDRIGVSPRRFMMDLVSRSEIADRAGVTRQAVGQWAIGTRQAGTFPAPYVLSGGGLWLWAEVAPALQALGYSVDEGLSHPARPQLETAVALLPADQAGAERLTAA